MGKALYRTYRSKKLSEIVGQEHITTALDHALRKGTISHAYLFTGPRGVGKTSIARILAHEINGLPYTEDRQHLDIIEIDAASNRRIDEIRDLRDKVHIAPSSAKYKVYIIDEVHMLTKEAFNALLKTLEEPPEHVVFILATTEVHKLPETIISRTQRYAFKPVDKTKVIDHLRHIATEEKINISDEALELIAEHGEGSFRDSISLLDQVRNNKNKTVELADVQAMLGIAPQEAVEATLACIRQHDAAGVAQCLQDMHNRGYEPSQIAKQLGLVLRNEVVHGKASLSHDVAIQLLSELVQVPASPNPRVALEIAVIDAALKEERHKATSDAPKTLSEGVQAPTPAIQVKPDRKPQQKQEEPATAVSEPDEAQPEDEAPSVMADSEALLNEEAWDLILNAVKPKYNTLYSILRTAAPRFEPGKITLEVPFAFHQKRLNEAKNKELLGQVIVGVTGSSLQISCERGEGRTPAAPTTPLPPAEGEIVHTAAPEPKPETPPVDALGTVSNIFGGGELLQP